MSIAPVRLRTESRVNPIGIDAVKPSFSWQLQSAESNVKQLAYEIMVYAGHRIVWNSGKVYSDEVMTVYDGEPLEARRSYRWTVTLWDLSGNREQSGTASFEMGLFTSDWTAKWIEPHQLDAVADPVDPEKFGENIERIKKGIRPEPSDYSKLRPAQYIRRQFTVKSDMKQARAYATAHGVYRLELNGERAGNAELAPDFTSYPQFLQYQTYDITGMLREGENVIGAVAADGWYISRIGNTGQSCGYGNRLAFLLQLEIEYENGFMERICSDEIFQSSEGPLIYSDLTIGERYDARKELTGWSTADYDHTFWKPCTVKDLPLNNIAAQSSAPAAVVERIKAVRAFTAPNGEKTVDFGQVIAGRVHMKVKGNPGDVIQIEHYETLDTGFLSTPFLLDILMEYGYKDMAYRILFQTQCPSWLYEVEQGATTIWEKWNAIEPDGQVGTCDMNHYAFGCVGDFIFRRIAGINMAEPGYKRSIIAPDFDCGLSFARGKTETIYGDISCFWEIVGERAAIDVSVPPNTAAVIILPHAGPEAAVEFSGTLRENAVYVEAGSGRHHFEYLLAKPDFSAAVQV